MSWTNSFLALRHMGQYVRWQMAFAALNYRQKRALDHLSCYFRAVKNIFPSQVV